MCFRRIKLAIIKSQTSRDPGTHQKGNRGLVPHWIMTSLTLTEKKLRKVATKNDEEIGQEATHESKLVVAGYLVVEIKGRMI